MSNHPPQLADLLRRIERLENHNRWLKRGALALVLALGSGFLMAADAPKLKTVEAERFVLHDRDGNVRAALEIGANGPRLALFAKGGSDVAVIGLGKDDTPALVLTGAKTKRRITLAVGDEEQALVFRDRDSNRVVLATDKDGEGVLLFRDGREKSRTLVSGYPGDPGLTVFDRDSKPRVILRLDKGESRLELTNDEGKPVFAQPPRKP